MSKTVTPYSSDKSKKEQVRSMFDSVARRYDFLNRLLSMGIDISWRRNLIRRLERLQPKKILDMATGTADLAIMAARVLPDSQITGIDLSPKMVELAQEKVKKKGINHVVIKVGDSEDIDESNATFDAAMVAFGVRNFENLEKGLKEIYRVLEDDSTFFILEFSKPTIFPVKQVFNLYFSTILPLIGKVFSHDKVAYRYLFESVQAFPDYDDMTRIMTQCGFKNCTWTSLSFGICCLYQGVK